MEKVFLNIENGQPVVIEMESKLPIYKNQYHKKLVSGRDLHEFLEIGTQYTKWFERMKEYGFEENQDFLAISQKRLTAQGNKTTYIDHAVNLDMAKEISMIQRNEKGRQARKYFIAVEKKLKEVATDPYKGLSPELKAVFVLDKKTQQIEAKVNNLESNMPLFNVECKELQALVRKAGIRVLGGYRTPAYKDNSLRGKVYADIQGQLKRQFGVSRYEAIKRVQLETAKEILGNYRVPIVLANEIEILNNQVSF